MQLNFVVLYLLTPYLFRAYYIHDANICFYHDSDLKLENVLFVGEELEETAVKVKGKRCTVFVPRDLRIKCTFTILYRTSYDLMYILVQTVPSNSFIHFECL